VPDLAHGQIFLCRKWHKPHEYVPELMKYGTNGQKGRVPQEAHYVFLKAIFL